MKKVFSVILVASMMLSLVACGGAGETASSALGNKSSSADNSNVSSTTISDLDAIGDVQVENWRPRSIKASQRFRALRVARM